MGIKRITEKVDTQHVELVFTEKQRANCEKLAKYMVELVEAISIDRSKKQTLPVFDMALFAVGRDEDDPDDSAYLRPWQLHKADCGTSCCLLGHGPLAGIEAVKPEAGSIDLELDDTDVVLQAWFNYAKEFLPDTIVPPTDEHGAPIVFQGHQPVRRDNPLTVWQMQVFEFVFGSDWDLYDNTRQGAVQRLWYVLDHGLPIWVAKQKLDDIDRNKWTTWRLVSPAYWLQDWVYFLTDQNDNAEPANITE